MVPSKSQAAARTPLPSENATALQEPLAQAMPHNANKAAEYDTEGAGDPPEGEHCEAAAPAFASTLSEGQESKKTGAAAEPGAARPVGVLDRRRNDATARRLSTNQGVPVADNQHSLRAGVRGPALLEDFILREKITHFDHERIPERVVHARGSGAHGYFECYEALTRYTRASLFAEAGKITPVFARFSTVAGERGSKDTARDVRGFAVKFYTDEGNWDLVGNNIPVFFIQDAMKFPDLIHALKPEPHNAMPQAASAHDTFWDFVSLTPESTHMLLWAMSDRAIPRSFRMMQGFGVHTFRFLDAEGVATLVKFHWTPRLGTHSLVWDEAVKIAGADPDFHRRDLWDAIEAGDYPEYELGVQLFTEEEAAGFPFDVLDATKIVPEEMVPVVPIGRMVLNRNPDNFFAETEQVAFCTAHIVPGLDFTSDPLLAGRIHSYVDTQISRLGGPNFHEIPINAPLAPVHNAQRDGMHRQAIHRGRIAYEPNSLGGGCPFQAGGAGFVSFREPVQGDKVRINPEKFAEHYAQARLFYDSQTAAEQAHIAAAFRFELSKVTVPAVRQRMVSGLANVSLDLARRVADSLGMAMPEPMPKASAKEADYPVSVSPALSLTAHRSDQLSSLRVAFLVAPGLRAAPMLALKSALEQRGAVPRFIASRLGRIESEDGELLDVQASMEGEPGVLFDALVLPDGQDAAMHLGLDGHTPEFVRDVYRHCKPIFVLDGSLPLLEAAGASPWLPNGEPDPGVVLGRDLTEEEGRTRFLAALAMRRHFQRETDPPGV